MVEGGGWKEEAGTSDNKGIFFSLLYCTPTNDVRRD